MTENQKWTVWSTDALLVRAHPQLQAHVACLAKRAESNPTADKLAALEARAVKAEAREMKLSRQVDELTAKLADAGEVVDGAIELRQALSPVRYPDGVIGLAAQIGYLVSYYEFAQQRQRRIETALASLQSAVNMRPGAHGVTP